MRRNKYGWKKVEDNIYTQDNYYKVNKSLITRKRGREYLVILRGTWSGKEDVLDSVLTKRKANEVMQLYMKKHRVG